jgi:hypothetical protein
MLNCIVFFITPLRALLGMENWGLITYMEGFLDIHPNTTSPDRRKRIARLIAHEVRQREKE